MDNAITTLCAFHHNQSNIIARPKRSKKHSISTAAQNTGNSGSEYTTDDTLTNPFR